MIVSHHGQYEFGSPKLPMTLEAIALHYLDNLDAKIHSFDKLIDEDANVDSAWTTYFPNIGRKLFKGRTVVQAARLQPAGIGGPCTSAYPGGRRATLTK